MHDVANFQINVRVDPQDDNGNTPLHLAVQRGDLESTRSLVNSGALVGVENNEAKAPIEYAKDDETKAFLVGMRNCRARLSPTALR